MNNISKLMMFLFFIFADTIFAETLTMGYRLTAREPFINKVGDNSGLYFDLYSTAAKKMNVNFKVVRLPKKRVLKKMEEGTIDFYPGFGFTKERAKYVYYQKNGLLGGWDIGVSLYSLPLITNLNQLKGKNVLAALGGADLESFNKIEGINVTLVPRLDIHKAITLIRKKRYHFYKDFYHSIMYYLKKHNIKDIKIHPNCCGTPEPMYFGFSRKSVNFQEEINLNYNDDLPISIDNFPTLISQESLAFRLAITLQKMKESGEIQKIFDKYFK